jgi:hypothetical protein
MRAIAQQTVQGLKFMQILRSLIIVVLFSVIQFGAKCYAQYVTGPVANAVGGAGLAANDEGDQNFLNPATLAQLKSMAIDYFYSDGYRGKDEHDRIYSFALADNSDDVAFSGGLIYTDRRRTFPQFNSLNERYIEFAFAGQLYKQLAWGLGIFNLNQQVEGDDTYTQTNARFGLFYNPHPDLGLGFIANNIAPTKDEILMNLRLKDELGIGANYIFMPIIRGRADIYRQTQYNPEGKLRWGGGFETLLDAYFIWRFGYQADDLTGRKYYTAGFGFTGPRLKIDYSYQKNVYDNRGGMHSVDFRMPL